jgi:hypothetical protein
MQRLAATKEFGPVDPKGRRAEIIRWSNRNGAVAEADMAQTEPDFDI